MSRTIVFLTVSMLALVTIRGVSAAPQSKGSSTLSGVVLGPDDKPVAHASVSYQLSSGSAPHAVHPDAHGYFSIAKLRADIYDLRASGKGASSPCVENI